MKYQKINDRDVEIILEDTPLDKLLKAMAKVSYELARPVRAGFLQKFDTKSEDVNFDDFVDLTGNDLLHMDYVNGRQCKTSVRRKEGKLLFNAWLYERDRGSSNLFLEKVREALEKCPLDPCSSGKPVYWDRVEVAAAMYDIPIDVDNPRESRLKVALRLDAEGREMEAIEIMMGKDFDVNGDEGSLLLTLMLNKSSPYKFYSGFADIDE